MRARMQTLAVVATLLALAVACGGVRTTTGAAPAASETAPSRTATSPLPTDMTALPSEGTTRDAPPDLIVASDAGTSPRRPYTYCWSGGGVSLCVDGRPTADDRVDVRGPLRLSLPLDDWTLTATRWADLDHPEGPRVPLRATGAGDWIVAERLPAGRHVVGIAGRGPEGDAFWVVPITVLGGR